MRSRKRGLLKVQRIMRMWNLRRSLKPARKFDDYGCGLVKVHDGGRVPIHAARIVWGYRVVGTKIVKGDQD